MRKGPILLLVGTAAVVGWIAPGLKAGDEARHARSAGASTGEAKAEPSHPSRRAAWLSGGTVLEREPDGHFYADATVASHRAHFLVDTGASIVALTAADAEAAGLRWSEADIIPIGRGASGTVLGIPVRLDRIELGGFEATNVEAAIIPQGLDVSLLGQSFLSRVEGVRIEGDRMVVGSAD